MTRGLGSERAVAVGTVLGMRVVLVTFVAVVGVRMLLLARQDVFQALLGLPKQRMKVHVRNSVEIPIGGVSKPVMRGSPGRKTGYRRETVIRRWW